MDYKRTQGDSEGMEVFVFFIGMIVSGAHTCIKTNHIAYIKYAKFSVF